MFLNSGSEAIDGALKLARRVTGRPGIIAFRGGFHGRTFGAASASRRSNINYRTGYEPLLPGVHFAPFPAAYRDFDGDEEAATERLPGRPPSRCSRPSIAPSTVGGDPDRAGPGRGRLQPGAGRRSCAGLRALCDEHGILLIADEVQTGLRPDRQDVGVRARRDRARTSCASPRRSPTACRCRRSSVDARAPGALGTRRARLDVRRQPGRLRGGRSRSSRRSATRAWSRTPRPAARSSTPGLGRIAAEDDRIGDVRGPGLMIGVEFVARPGDRRARRRPRPTR